MRRWKEYMLVVSVIVLLAGCAPGGAATTPAPDEMLLTVRGPEVEQTYTLAELQAMPATSVESDDGTFVGVRLSDLLTEAGFDMGQIATVQVIALDNFSSTYDSALFMRQDAVLAYARQEGSLNENELPLRMVIPGQEGRMQPRQVATIEVTTGP